MLKANLELIYCTFESGLRFRFDVQVKDNLYKAMVKQSVLYNDYYL